MKSLGLHQKMIDGTEHPAVFSEFFYPLPFTGPQTQIRG